MIYVLACENNKYYIGYTKQPKKRIEAHFGACGSEWTKLHKPLRIIKTIEKHDKFDEDKLTKQYMAEFGIEHVRGGTYVQIRLPEYQKMALRDELRMASGACMRCGEMGHFIATCKHVVHKHPEIGLQTETVEYVHASSQTYQESSFYPYYIVVGLICLFIYIFLM